MEILTYQQHTETALILSPATRAAISRVLLEDMPMRPANMSRGYWRGLLLGRETVLPLDYLQDLFEVLTIAGGQALMDALHVPTPRGGLR